MSVTELEEWIASARRIAAHSGQVIDDYEVVFQKTDGLDYGQVVPRIDHGRDELILWIS